MNPKFIYFDLGKVLVDFSFERMYRQMAEAAGIEPRQVEAALAAGLQLDYETGKLDARTFYSAFCRQTCTHPSCDALSHAFNDIFAPIHSMLPIVAQLHQAGYRLGVLSNTCEGHWSHCIQHYHMLREFFGVHALSYEIETAKPDAAIFRKAAELADCQPEEIFYTDDIAGHVAAARSVGFDAVVYTSTAELVGELRRRGVQFNY
jgi:glucose-1-phosphatase